MEIKNLKELADYLEIDAEPSEANAALQAAIEKKLITLNDKDDSITYEVRKPVKYFSTDSQEGKLIKFPRPTAKVMIRFLDNQKKGDGTAMLEAITTATRITHKSCEDMDVKDFLVLSNIMTLFL